MRRLYLQIYVTFVVILFLLGFLISLAWLWLVPRDDVGLQALAAMAEEMLPEPGASSVELKGTIERIHAKFAVSLALFDERGRLLAAAGEPVLRPESTWTRSRVIRSRGRGLTLALKLDDGRWIVVRHRQSSRALRALSAILLTALAVAIGAFPLVRRLTRRLERLQARVDALGKGELGARVEVEGRDEVAKLASSFNLAAERIERLVEAQRALLAGASHELRSPLTRIRMALELLPSDVPAELRETVARDVGALDELIGELILASRIEAREAIGAGQSIDVLALAAEEAARYDASVRGAPAVIEGDAPLVRRLLRNLLENARRHAASGPIEVEVDPAPGSGARIRVLDRGGGVPEDERERVFDPFYQLRSTARVGDRGMGLGLALVRRIARLHRGDALCLPREGGGSVFEAVLYGLSREPKSSREGDREIGILEKTNGR